MGMVLRVGISFVSFATALACVAQNEWFESNKESGMVNGTVTCADTNSPARLSRVYLVPLTGSLGTRYTAQSDLEGHWALRVPVGEYYVAAVMQGYVDLLFALDQARMKTASEGKTARPDVNVPIVSISARQPAEIAILLERGAEIDGTVSFDDGSPAIGLQVGIRPSQIDGPASPADGLIGAQLPHITDDHGHFRILGVAQGEYRVSVWVPIPPTDSGRYSPILQSFAPPLANGWAAFAENVHRVSKARVIKIEPGDATANADITIPLGSLHTVRGHVLMKSTGQSPAIAGIELLYADSRKVARTAIAPDGDFELRYVSEDSYILRAVASSRPFSKADILSDDETRVGHAVAVGIGFKWGSDDPGQEVAAEMPLQVNSDVDGLTLIVPDPPGWKEMSESPDSNQTKVDDPVPHVKPE